jgi:hypothetical protein
MSERYWFEAHADEAHYDGCGCKSDREVLIEMPLEALIVEMYRRGLGVVYGAREDPDFVLPWNVEQGDG